jgi:hypothetical protein
MDAAYTATILSLAMNVTKIDQCSMDRWNLDSEQNRATIANKHGEGKVRDGTT